MLLLDDGSVGGRHVVPEDWLRQARHIDADIRGAFAASDSEPVLPGGWYRNQFWFVPGPSGDILLCLGIHGQMVFVDHATRTVAVKLSSWPTAQDPPICSIRSGLSRPSVATWPGSNRSAMPPPPGRRARAASPRVRNAGAGERNAGGRAYLTYPIGTTVGVSGSFSLTYCDRMPSM